MTDLKPPAPEERPSIFAWAMHWQWIARRRWLASLIIVIFSVIALGGYVAPDWVVQRLNQLTTSEPEPEIDDAEDQLDSDEDFVPPPVVKTFEFENYGSAILVVRTDSLFSQQGTVAIRDVVDSIQRLDYVNDVLWVDKIPPLNLFGLNESLLPRETAPQAAFDNARKKAREHPLVNGRLISDDGKTLVMILEIDYLFVESDAVFTHELRETAESAAARHPDVEMDFMVTGGPAVYLTAVQNQEENRIKYQAIAYAIILILSMILFRGIIAVIVVAMAPAFGIFWTTGMIRYLELQMNPFNDVVLPVLVALIGFTDGVHLMVQIRRERMNGLGPFEAAQEGLRKVGLACFLTSLTTAIGFGSLYLAENELVREFGMCSVLGVGLAFISVILTIPLACSTPLGQRIHRGYGKGFVDQNISRISVIIDFVLKHRAWVSVVGILLSITLFAVSMTLRPDSREADILPPSSEPVKALRIMDETMGGLQEVTIHIEWTGDQGLDHDEYEDRLFTVLEEIDKSLKKEELIGHPVSIYNLLVALPGDSDVKQKVSMLELLPPSLKRTFYIPESRYATVTFRCQDLGIARYGPVFERIETRLQTLQGDDFSITLYGDIIYRWRNIYQIVVDLVKSLGTAAIIIFVILSVVYRSLRIGLISIMPNLFPLCVAGTYLVATGQMLEVVTVCAFTCCLGIAVDDTIHFLTRYVEEKRETKDESLAIRRAFVSVGTALVITTLVLVSGFLTVLTSETRDHRVFASMGAITVAAALFGDLVFLPAVLARFASSKNNEAKEPESPSPGASGDETR